MNEKLHIVNERRGGEGGGGVIRRRGAAFIIKKNPQLHKAEEAVRAHVSGAAH